MAQNLGLLLERALSERRRSNWESAQHLYERAASAAPGTAYIHQNLALCLYARGRLGEAMEHARLATQGAPGLPEAWVLRARIERGTGQAETACTSLEAALEIAPHHPAALLELADLTLNELGDARRVPQLVAPLLKHPEYGEDARLATLTSKFYDRDESPDELTLQIVHFARCHFRLPPARPRTRLALPKLSRKKLRVGLISPLFCVSPVYFFAYGALSRLAGEVDFVVLSRGTRNDWASHSFRTIAREWHSCAHLPASQLAATIRTLELDVLIDLGGWSDAAALKALSTRPAKRMYKWVGGQSATTGMNVFDGFITDEVQTPSGSARLYTEPLVRLAGGYVSYTPPAYLPDPVAERRYRYGVIGNPAKVTAKIRPALEYVARSGQPIVFVDRRYARARVADSVLKRVGLDRSAAQFIAPVSHEDYLATVSRIATVIDTTPYNGGLTTMEALAMGVEVVSEPGELFMERHTESHREFFGRWGKPRSDHDALAKSLRDLLVSGAR